MVDKQTGEIVVSERAEFMPLDIQSMLDKINYIEQFKEKVLKVDLDYGIIPGTKKPTIYKSGAEKLAFAFNLGAKYEVESKIEDPFKEWEFETSNGKKVARGYFRYTVRCILINKSTGETWGSQLADCDSLERGRETAPSNTILKMAEKRAFNGAVLNATFTSDRFTQDLEDYDPSQRTPGNVDRAESAGAEPRWFPSRFGSQDKPNKCHYCGKGHIVAGDLIGFVKAGEKGVGAKDCYAKDQPAESPSESPFTPETVETLQKLAVKELVDRAIDLEVAVFGDDEKILAYRRGMVNQAVLSLPDLAKCTKPQLTHYIMALSNEQAGPNEN